MPKIKVLSKGGGGDKTTVVKAPNVFSLWGNEAANAKGEGWIPATGGEVGQTIFRNTYNPGANTVVIPGEKNYGHLAAVGYKNGTFDLVIRDANGKVRKEIKKGVAPNDIRSYFTNAASPVAGRFNSIVSGTNQDRPDAGGNYAALYNQSLVK